MSRTALPARASRVGIVAAVTAALVTATAGPAAAHVEVEAEGARALAKDVTITFEAESESDSAGITKLDVTLPEGIDAKDVTYKDGPDGWKFKASGDGYTVEGPKVDVGENANHSISIAQLPDAEELAFKTLQSYDDGRTDRWIEVPQEGKAEPETPAPVLKLEPAEDGASAEPPESSGDDSAEPSPSEQADDAAAPKEDDGLPMAVWFIIVAGVLAALSAAGVLLMRRGANSGK
ncbi:DUF1775 domain-containing protein [Streptomyces bathyalis]|uniref:DUF1775 domain-containing protein n=1 Tax=Streptomyces bathyalis TaxID=2710756 RepID=A0A7T1T7A3_9ACTN|nr:DUF1775 domain-containing protein [Streptomyces bathyalis]QPP07717.1 DUF1775 domain-containing protein [Streptomyces bathyalis]